MKVDEQVKRSHTQLSAKYMLMSMIFFFLCETIADYFMPPSKYFKYFITPPLPSNWIIHRHHQPLTFCISPVAQETQTQLLLRPGGVEWSQAAGGRGALWGWIPAALCPGEGGDCQDTQP